MNDAMKMKKTKIALIVIVVGIALLVMSALASYMFLDWSAGPDIIDTPVYEYQKADMRDAGTYGRKIMIERDPEQAAGTIEKGVPDAPDRKLPTQPNVKYDRSEA